MPPFLLTWDCEQWLRPQPAAWWGAVRPSENPSPRRGGHLSSHARPGPGLLPWLSPPADGKGPAPHCNLSPQRSECSPKPLWSEQEAQAPFLPLFSWQKTFFPPFLHIWRMVPPFSPPRWRVRAAERSRRQGPTQEAERRGLRGPRTQTVRVGARVGGAGSPVSAPHPGLCAAPAWAGALHPKSAHRAARRGGESQEGPPPSLLLGGPPRPLLIQGGVEAPLNRRLTRCLTRALVSGRAPSLSFLTQQGPGPRPPAITRC